MSRYVDDVRVATSAFEAAQWQNCVAATCTCGHVAVFDPHALWWHCYQKGWDDRFSQLSKRFYCTRCYALDKRCRVHPTFDVTKREPTFDLPLPPEREWKRAVRRVRS